MSNGSQQASKSAPKIPTTTDISVSVFDYQVLRQPVFSIGLSNVTSPQIARLKRQNKMVKIEEQIPKKTKLTQAYWSNQSSLWPDQKTMSLMLKSLLTISVIILTEIILQEST